MKEFKIRTSLEPNIFNFSVKMDSSFLIVDTIHSIIVFYKKWIKATTTYNEYYVFKFLYI